MRRHLAAYAAAIACAPVLASSPDVGDWREANEQVRKAASSFGHTLSNMCTRLADTQQSSSKSIVQTLDAVLPILLHKVGFLHVYLCLLYAMHVYMCMHV